MSRRFEWVDGAWGKFYLAISSVVLAVVGVAGGIDGRWVLITGSALYMSFYYLVTAFGEQSVVRRLGRDYDRVQSRAVQIVSDLGQLAGNQFELWMVDLYLPERRWSIRQRWPFVVSQISLSRQLSVSLIDARFQPPVVDASFGPHGESYSQVRSILWCNRDIKEPSASSSWTMYVGGTNEDLASTYGVFSISPLVDQLGKNCLGVLAVHVDLDPSKTIRALGVLQSPEGFLRINNACVELNGLLGR